MRGTLRVNKPVASIRLRIRVEGLPSGTVVEVTDVMFQPGSTSSGWLPHVTELPWHMQVVS